MRYTVIVNASRIQPETRREFRRRQNLQRQVEDARRQRFIYFLKQKTVGAGCILLAVLSALLLDGDITIGVAAIPMGLYLIFSREMIIDNEYYRRNKEW